MLEGNSYKTHLRTAIWGAKLVLVPTAILYGAMLFKVTIIPHIMDLLLYTLPSLWFSFTNMLSLPYLYFIVNFIIIVIVASSNFQQHPNHTNKVDSVLANKEGHISHFHDEAANGVCWQDIPSNNNNNNKNSNEKQEEEPSPEAEIWSEHEEEEEETLDTTWKAITEGSDKRRLEKSKTCVVERDNPASWERKELRKSDTFSDRVSVRRDMSMSQEELNRRAEEFIKRFNRDMRLERQESDQRFNEMVNRGL